MIGQSRDRCQGLQSVDCSRYVFLVVCLGFVPNSRGNNLGPIAVCSSSISAAAYMSKVVLFLFILGEYVYCFWELT